MKILLTGATGYIGSHLLPILQAQGHTIVALARGRNKIRKNIEVIQADLLDPKTLKTLPKDIDAAYYLVHSMSRHPKDFEKKDKKAAENFRKALEETHCKQIIYLSGLTQNGQLSKHFSSRQEVENILGDGNIPVTTLRSSIIIGQGSASFEIIRDLVEKLPIMTTPKWVRNKCQPIAITDVLDYLLKVLGNPACFSKTFEIGGPEAMTYQDMLLRYAKKRGLKRIIIPVPVLTPRISSYWLIFITKTNFYLAQSLIDSLKNDSVRIDFSIDAIIPKKCLSYEKALEMALT